MIKHSVLVFLLSICAQAQYSKLTIDFVENNRRCTNDAAIVRECNVAYGHFTITEAAEWKTQPTTYRTVLLCENAGQPLGRSDCINLEAGKAYSWTLAYDQVQIDRGYMYELYGDFPVPVYIETGHGRGYYARKDLRPERR